MAKRKANGNGSFRVRGEKLEYRVSYIDNNGERRSKSFTANTEEECYNRAEKFFIALAKGEYDRPPDDTLPAILRRKYETDYRRNFIAEPGYARNLDFLKILEGNPIGKKSIKKITQRELEKYIDSLVIYSNSVIEKLFLQVRIAYREAVRSGLVELNLVEYYDMRAPKSNRPTKKVRGMNEDEQKLFVEGIYKVPRNYNTQDYIPQLLIELYTGMRMGEINALTPADIDFKRNMIHVHKTISIGLNRRRYINDTTKTDAGNRYVPINELVRPILEKAITDMRDNPDGLIFYDYKKNDYVTTQQVGSYFKRVCSKLNLPFTGQHALRHTFATRCIEAGVSPVVLKTWLGHTDIHVTLDTYSDVFDRMNNTAIGQFESYINNNINT